MLPLSPDAKAFLEEHLHHDPAQLMLQAKRWPQLPVAELVQQIAARQKAVQKLPTWAANINLLFPANLSVEQASSEQTAAFKASLVQGKLLVDLTGGFGIDSSFFARSFTRVEYVERNQELTEVVKHNLEQLEINNVNCNASTAEEFLQHFTDLADCFYLDPARRGSSNQKLHLLQDCEPDILQLLPELLRKGKQVLLKTSPLLDIDLAIQQLGQVAHVWIVAVDNECKEVLYLIQQHASATAVITAVNLVKNQEAPDIFTFTKEEEAQTAVDFAAPQDFIYEPNAAILKAGAFKSVAKKYQLFKLHPNSHLYTSSTFIPDFPGRSFKLTAVCRYNKKDLQTLIPQKKANITVRNFPDPVAAIRKKTGLKEGGNMYLFATTNQQNKPVILVCEKA